MNEENTVQKIQRRSRNATDFSEKSVKHFFFSEATKLPIVFQAEYPGIDLKTWISENTDFIKKELQTYGAVLFRNFSNSSIGDFDRVVRAWNAELMDYDFGSTPRSNLQSGIYTSTEYPPDQEIVMHNEMAYSKRYPSYLWFYCHLAAEEGGCTPLADSREVYKLLGEEITRQFETRKVLYCRNYQKGIDVPWTQVFRTTDKNEVAKYCEQYDIEYEWVTEDHLRTKELCEGVIVHPETGEKVWFNQAHLFHISNLSEDLAGQLALMPEEDLPRNAFWGDGSPIDPSYLYKIREIFIQAKVRFDWQSGDMLLIDNLLASHGRDSYKGNRKVLVAMQGPLTA